MAGTKKSVLLSATTRSATASLFCNAASGSVVPLVSISIKESKRSGTIRSKAIEM